jgi:diguanylate cyclase (GGDEF)-like protein/PAS domain S-box-containing protein
MNDFDTTKEHLLEEKSAKTSSLLATVLDGVDAIVYVADMKTYEVLYVNRYTRDIFGELKGKICWQSIQSGQTGPCDFCSNKHLLDENGRPKGVYQWEFQNTVNGCWYDIRDRAVEWIDGRMARLEIAYDISKRKNRESALLESEERFQGAFQYASIGIALVSPEGKWIKVNSALCSIVGYSEEELLSLTFQDITHPDDLDADLEYVRQMLSGEIRNFHMEKRYYHKDGHIVWILLSVSLVRDKYKNPLYFVAQIQDITDRKQAEDQLRERMKLAELSSDIGIALTKGHTLDESLQLSSEAIVKHLEALFARIWIFNEKEKVLELKSSAGLYTHLNGPHSRIPLGKYKIGIIAEERRPHLTNSVVGDPNISDQEWAKREEIIAFAGHPLVIDNKLIGVMALFSRNPFTGIVLNALSHMANIVTLGIQQKIMVDKHRELAITDDLTGLLNRRGFFALAEHQCRVATRSNKIIALLYLDLDGLKIINDELGHEAGDQALVDTANIFKATFRSSDIIARMGGDEFAVLLTDLPNPNDENTIIKHLLDNLTKHNESGRRNYELGISIGIAFYSPEDSCSVGKLLNQADKSMYKNKKRSKI